MSRRMISESSEPLKSSGLGQAVSKARVISLFIFIKRSKTSFVCFLVGQLRSPSDDVRFNISLIERGSQE